jgi:hypothetical protein
MYWFHIHSIIKVVFIFQANVSKNLPSSAVTDPGSSSCSKQLDTGQQDGNRGNQAETGLDSVTQASSLIKPAADKTEQK